MEASTTSQPICHQRIQLTQVKVWSRTRTIRTSLSPPACKPYTCSRTPTDRVVRARLSMASMLHSSCIQNISLRTDYFLTLGCGHMPVVTTASASNRQMLILSLVMTAAVIFRRSAGIMPIEPGWIAVFNMRATGIELQRM